MNNGNSNSFYIYKNIIYKELNETLQITQKFINDESNIRAIEYSAKIIANAFKSKRKVITCGNGGSHCDAMHFAEELSGLYRENRPGYPAITISDSSYISCVSNDLGYEQIFSRYIEAIGNKGDVLVVISTSGNSENIVRAIEIAISKNMRTIALIGKGGGKISGRTDSEILVPHFNYSDRIQEVHIKIIHILVLIIEKEMLI